MKILRNLAVIGSVMILMVSCGSTKKNKEMSISKAMKESITKKGVEKHIVKWSIDSKDAAHAMMSKYGLPTDVTSNTLVWHHNGPFAKTVVYRDQVKHLFPTPHNDVVEHFVYYASPNANEVAKIWDFSGSVNLDRTLGMMSSRSDSEEGNILALNLADQIIKGEKSVSEARMDYGKYLMQLSNASEQPSHLTQTLVFSTTNERVGDPDHTISDKVKRQRIQAEEEIE